MPNQLFRRKSIDQIKKDYDSTHGGGLGNLRKVLGVWDLTFLGIAAVIGAGIFSTIGNAAFHGGPGVSILFIITAVACGFSALCYAEFASRVPVAGSAYTYSYVTFGELIAWIIGWALILEYAIGNIVVAISWSGYFNNLLENVFNLHLPEWMLVDPGTAKSAYTEASKALAAGGLTDAEQIKNYNFAVQAWNDAPVVAGQKVFFNFPAFIIVILITWLAYTGIRESKQSANFMVLFKVAVIIFVIIAGVFFVDTNNWTPFLPNRFEGVLKGVSAVFYAYIGFDAISTTAEEARNPQRDMPKAMIYSLLICTILYILIALVLTGIENYSNFKDVNDPLAFVFEKRAPWIETIVSISAVIATTSVLLVFQLGQPRIWMSMSRDGLLPRKFQKIHPKYQTPSFATIVTGFLVGIPALFLESGLVTDLTSIGTLFAFALVAGGVLLLPRIAKEPGRFSLPYINGRIMIPVIALLFFLAFSNRIANAFTYKVAGKSPEVTKPLGASYGNMTSLNAEGDTTRYSGLPVLQIEDGSTMERAGLRVNDVIVSYNDRPVNNQDSLRTYIQKTKTSEDISIGYIRNQELKSGQVSRGTQEILFLIFSLVLLPLIAILTFFRSYSFIPIMGVLFCLYLMVEIPAKSWLVFFGWMALGLIIYFLYGYRNSKLAQPEAVS